MARSTTDMRSASLCSSDADARAISESPPPISAVDWPAISLRRGWSYGLFLITMVSLGVFFVISQLTGTPFAVFTRDPLAVTDGQPYFGLFSNIGILFWCAAAVICLFAWFVTQHASQSAMRNFLLCSGTLTLLLLLDDLFMLHENVFPEILGIRQRYVLLTYLLLTFAWLVRFRKTILAGRCISLLLVALAFFATSLAADVFSLYTDDEHWLHLWEDGAKLIGIVAWFNYFLHVGANEVMRHYPTKNA